MAREISESGSRVLIGAGGDGTLFEAVNGCMQSGGPMPNLALIPVGSGNEFAKSLGIPESWEDASDRIELGAKRKVDVGQCNDVYFINSLGVGLDARVADFASRYRWLKGKSVYIAGLLRALVHQPRMALNVSFDGGHVEQEMTLLALANGGYLGGRFQLVPDANIEDGRLDLVITPRLSRREIISLAPLVVEGRHLDHPGFARHLTRRATVNSKEALVVQADGEIIYRRANRLEIGVIPGALTFIC
jgi:diacylglycerol kinase (ATP)